MMRQRFLFVVPLLAMFLIGALAACGGRGGDSDLLRIRRWEDRRTLAGDSLTTLLEDGAKATRASAARALGRIGHEAALEPLLAALHSESRPEVRREIAFALGILGQPDAIAGIATELDREHDVETLAQLVLAVGRLGQPGTASLVLPVLENEHGRIRESAVEALALLADPTTVTALLLATADPDDEVAWRATYALEKIPGSMQTERLVELLKSPSQKVRRAAARSLGRLEAREASGALLEALENAGDDWQLRLRLIDSLGRIGNGTPETFDRIESCLHDPNFHVRVATLQAIGRAAWRQLIPVTMDSRQDEVVDVRVAAYEALSECLDGRNFEIVAPGLEDPSPIVVATCLRLLGSAEDPRGLERVREALAGTSARAIRLAAAQGLAAAGERVPIDELILALRDRDPFIATTIAEALSKRADAKATPALLDATRRVDDPSSDVRIAAINALGEIAAENAVPRLRELLGEHPDMRVRLESRRALERILPPAESAALPTEAAIRSEVRPAVRSGAQAPVVERSGARQLILHTTRGRVVIDLFGEDAPQMVENFARLADSGFFDNLTFHRVVGDFVVQGGDPTHTGWGDAGYTIRSEWNPRRYDRGTVGIAHSGKDTGSCQLFITQSPQPHLDARYTIWGEVVTGMEVVDRIQRGDTFRAEVVWDTTGR